MFFLVKVVVVKGTARTAAEVQLECAAGNEQQLDLDL